MAYNQSHLLKFCVSNIFNAHFSYPHWTNAHNDTITTEKQHLCEYFEFSCWLCFAVLFQFYFDFIRDRNRKDQLLRIYFEFTKNFLN